MDVSLSHQSFYSAYVLRRPGQKDPIPLRRSLRFYDKGLCSLFIKLLSEILILRGQKPCLRVETVLIRKFFPHAVQITSQLVFP